MATVTFQDLIASGHLEIGDGYRAKNSELGGDGPIFLRAGHLTDARFDFENVERFRSSLALSLEGKMAKAGDTVVTTKGNSTGRVGYVEPDFPQFVYSPHLSYWRSKRPAALLPGFIRYWSRGREFRDQLQAMKTSTDMAPYLSLTDQRRLRITLPDPKTQKAIGSALTTLDDKIELNRRMNHTLEEMASVLFERLMIGVDDDPALDVSVQSLIDRQLLVVGDGYRAKNEELASEGLPFARAGNIDAGFRFDDTELLGWPAVTSAGTKVSVPFDVVFTSKGTVGRFAFVSPTTPKFAYSPQLCFWRSVDHDVLSPFFLYHWMRSSRFLEQVDAVKGQTDMADYVSLTDQRLMKIACPKCDDHRRLRDDVAMLWELHFANTDESKTLTALRDALLPKVLSGEITLKAAEKTVAEVV